MVGTDVILSLARGVHYHLPLWDSALGKGWEEGGGCFRFKSWLYMIIVVKQLWVHSIYCFMLLVQGVRLDWLVFHMISFLLMHILQGCILTFDERQPSMEESLSCQIFLLEITRGNVAAACGNATRVTIFFGPVFDWYFWTPLPPSLTFAYSTLLG